MSKAAKKYNFKGRRFEDKDVLPETKFPIVVKVQSKPFNPFTQDNPFDEEAVFSTKSVSGDEDVLDITDFPEEMKEVIKLNTELDRYFLFLSKLPRDQLLVILKYEVYNRIFTQSILGDEKDE